MTVSKRILVLILLPALAIAGLAAWRVAEQWATARRMERLLDSAEAVRSLSKLVMALQSERVLTSSFLRTSAGDGDTELLAKRGEADRAVESASRFLAEATGGALGADLAAAATDFRTEHGRLSGLRGRVLARALPAADTRVYFDSLIAKLIKVSLLVMREADRADIKNLSLALGDLQMAGENAGRARAAGVALLLSDVTQERLIRLAVQVEEEIDFAELALLYAPSDIVQLYTAAKASSDYVGLEKLRQALLATQPGTRPSVAEKAWFAAATTRVELFKDLQDRLTARIEQAGSEALGSARLQLALASGVTLVLLLASAGIGLWTARSIIRPLDAMVLAMKRLASGDHGVEIQAIGRRDEIGAMAGAVQVFKDAAIEKLRLEGESQDQRRAAEAERAEAEREREAARAAQEAVVSALAGALARLAEGDLACRIGQAFPAE
ncbi:MAG: nitrate- and nitrite sensing domain-containing protein, partial [Methylobacteriaceae bacterium]|nr:nitrate- and nitrite sensing domain-containing protein [Methylobacteriaceae bacterium]